MFKVSLLLTFLLLSFFLSLVFLTKFLSFFPSPSPIAEFFGSYLSFGFPVKGTAPTFCDVFLNVSYFEMEVRVLVSVIVYGCVVCVCDYLLLEYDGGLIFCIF